MQSRSFCRRRRTDGLRDAAAPATRSAEAEAEFQKLIAGKVAGQPIGCLPSYRSNDMVTIDDNTDRCSANGKHRST